MQNSAVPATKHTYRYGRKSPNKRPSFIARQNPIPHSLRLCQERSGFEPFKFKILSDICFPIIVWILIQPYLHNIEPAHVASTPSLCDAY